MSSTLRDLFIAIIGLALSIIFGVLPYLEVTLPRWLTVTGILIGVFLLGLAVGLLRGERSVVRRNKVYNGSTYLHLRTFGDNRLPDKLGHENIFRWYLLSSFINEINIETRESNLRPGLSILYIAFDRDVPIATFKVRSPDMALPSFEIKEFNQRYAIVAFYGQLPSGTLEASVQV